MDFFASQEQARRRTSLMVCYFALAVLLIVLAAYVVIALAWNLAFLQTSRPWKIWEAQLFFFVSGLILALVAGASLFEWSRLSRGGGAGVATLLGGRLIPPNSDIAQERKLLNVVEEMALAAGLPPPPVYVLDGEKGINAFAAGHDPSDAVIGVTRGALETFSRDELQGVIGHEFSHILNGDMRLNIRLMGILQGILLLALLGKLLLRSMRFTRTSTRGKSGGGVLLLVVLGAGLTAVGMIGVFFGKLIKSAVSRQREYLADAAAVQFTRHPAGLAGALKKIGGFSRGSWLQSPYMEQASHLFFEHGDPGGPIALLATHPPLVERIRRIDPGFDGVFPRFFGSEQEERDAGDRAKVRQAAAAAFAGAAVMPAVAAASRGAVPERLMESIGAPLRAHMDGVMAMLDALPEGLREALREPFGARAVVYVLLLDDRPEIREKQRASLEAQADPAVLAETERWMPFAGRWPPASRLALLDLALPALRTLSADQYRVFQANATALAAADEEINLFEYALLHVLRRHLEAHFKGPAKRMAQIYGWRGLEQEASTLLSLTARIGRPEDDAEGVEAAFGAAVAHLDDPRATFRLAPPEACTLEQVDPALDRLDLAAPRLKKALVAACLVCFTHNGEVTPEETELFRAVACALDVPVPPWALAAA